MKKKGNRKQRRDLINKGKALLGEPPLETALEAIVRTFEEYPIDKFCNIKFQKGKWKGCELYGRCSVIVDLIREKHITIRENTDDWDVSVPEDECYDNDDLELKVYD